MGEFTNISYIQKLFDDYSHEKSFNEELPSDCDVDLFPNQFVYEELIKNKLSHKDNKVIPFLLKFSIDNFISFISDLKNVISTNLSTAFISQRCFKSLSNVLSSISPLKSSTVSIIIKVSVSL